MTDILMPRLSDSMEEGTIIRWLKASGDTVSRGEEIVEIETDKATMTYESDGDGVLNIVAEEGDTLAVGKLIARVGDSAESPAAEAAATAPEAEDAPSQAPAEEAAPAQPETATAVAEPAAGPGAGGNGAASDRVKASPVARRIAAERGVDLAALAGTGPGGRIVKSDVEGAAAGAPVKAPADAPPPPPPSSAAPALGSAPGETGKGETTLTELNRVQQVIARRMAESRATVPVFTLRATVDMTQATELRAGLKASGADVVPSFNDLVVKACAIALRDDPKANGAYRDAKFERYSRVNIGVAVAAEGTLVVPTIFDADRKGLAQIAQETRALAERVRAGVVTPPELSGGTFTVSNLGMFGVRSFEAVINPPQAAILAVGALEPRPAVRDGEIVVRQLMDVELACDHRILYGAEAAQFLARIVGILQAPLALAL